MLLEPGKWC
jgi:hypothetical protein